MRRHAVENTLTSLALLAVIIHDRAHKRLAAWRNRKAS